MVFFFLFLSIGAWVHFFEKVFGLLNRRGLDFPQGSFFQNMFFLFFCFPGFFLSNVFLEGFLLTCFFKVSF